MTPSQTNTYQIQSQEEKQMREQLTMIFKQMTFNYENFANATEDVIQTPSFLAKSMSVKVPKEKNLINEEEEQKGVLR